MQIAIPAPLRWLAVRILTPIVLVFPVSNDLRAQTAASQQQTAGDKPYVIEYYYKAKWGHAEEFIALFKKNHYPVLTKEIDLAPILTVFPQLPPSPAPAHPPSH